MTTTKKKTTAKKPPVVKNNMSILSFFGQKSHKKSKKVSKLMPKRISHKVSNSKATLFKSLRAYKDRYILSEERKMNFENVLI